MQAHAVWFVSAPDSQNQAPLMLILGSRLVEFFLVRNSNLFSSTGEAFSDIKPQFYKTF